jgi:transposase
LSSLVDQFGALADQIDSLEGQILEWHRSDENSRRLATITGIGPITASSIAATVSDPGQFRSGRQFAA